MEKRSVVSNRYQGATPIPGISQLHSFIFHSDGVVEAAQCHQAPYKIIRYYVAFVKELTETSCQSPLYNVNDWVGVLFDEDWFPGSIENIDGTKLFIKFMSRKALNQ
jgi:hypothetical protein